MSSHIAAVQGSHQNHHHDGSSARHLYTSSHHHQEEEEPNPQSGSVNPPPTTPRKKGRKDLPPLFWYMEMGDWEKATARAKSHPKEVKSRATLRTKSMAEDGTKVTGTKRLALHHACFKLRSAGSAPIPESSHDDSFLAVCKFILLLLEIYPDACQARESRHGCLPLHLAAFASCYVRPPSKDDEELPIPAISATPSSGSHSSAAGLERPKILSVRSCSESTASTVHSNMTAILMEESFAAAQTLRKKEGEAPPPMTAAHATQQPQPTNNEEITPKQTIFISNKREQMAVKVLNAMLDAYPRAIRLDSEGGRLPLHTACAGRATPRCV